MRNNEIDFCHISTGAHARGNTRKAPTSQYHLYGALKKTIEFYNRNNENNKIELPLNTPENIRTVIETLSGEKLGK